MQKVKLYLNRAEEIVSSLCLASMIFIISIQVFRRYVLHNSLDWSEELARYCFICAVYIGCSFAVQKNAHLEVTILRNFGSDLWKKIVAVISYICTIVFCGSIAVWGTNMVLFLMRTGQKTQALEISIFWIYIAIPLGLGLMGLRTGINLWQLLTGKITAPGVDSGGQF